MACTELPMLNASVVRATPDGAAVPNADSLQWAGAIERCRAIDEAAIDANDESDAMADAEGEAGAAFDTGGMALAAPITATGLAPLAASFEGTGASVSVHGDHAPTVPGRAAPTSPSVAALAFTAQTLMCLEGQTGIAKIDFQCQVRGGLLDGAVLQLGADAGHGGIDSVVVRLPRQRWRALQAQRSELIRALGSAVGHGVLVEVVADEGV